MKYFYSLAIAIVISLIITNKIKAESHAAVDSLTVLLETQENKLDRFTTLGLLFAELSTVDPKLCLKYAQEQLSIAQEINDDSKEAVATSNMGTAYLRLAEYDKAMQSYFDALPLFEKDNDDAGIAKCHGNIGNVYYFLGQLEKAMEHYYTCAKYLKKAGDYVGVASTHNNIGVIYWTQGKFENAIEEYKVCLEAYDELKDETSKSNVYNNIGVLYVTLKAYDKAEENILKSIEICKERNDQQALALSWLNMADVYSKRGDYKKAIEICNRSISIFRKSGLREDIMDAYDVISDIHSQHQNYKEALTYYVMKSALKDSIITQKTQNELAELATKYDTEKKDQQIKLHELSLEKKNTIQKYLYAVIGLIILALAFAFYAFMNKRKSNIVLQTKNELINHQNAELTQKNEEITDSIKYAKRIQQAILPSDKLVKEHLLNSFILYQPKDIVSGDFYWMERVGDHLLFAVVDCTGHGVPGAFMSLVGYNALNQVVREEKITQPDLILNRTTEIVVHNLTQTHEEVSVKDGMDIALCNLNLKTNEIQFAGAFNPLYLLRNNEIEIFKGNKFAIGPSDEAENKTFTNIIIQLQKGDVVYVFSDGYADQFGGPRDKKFTYKRFRELLVENHKSPMVEQRQSLIDAFESWKGDQEQIDDICMIGVKI